MTKRKRKRGKARKKGGAKVSPFSRVGRSEAAPFVFARHVDPIASQRGQVYRILVHRGVATDVARMIAYEEMDPDHSYIVTIYGYAGSRDEDGAGRMGDVPVRQADFVGECRQVWARLIGYASKAPIEYVEINELAPDSLDHPLWDTDSVQTVSGVSVVGHGNKAEWLDRRKRGARKKGGGGMPAPERRKNRKGKNAAIQRRQALNKRIAKLKKTDPVAAVRLQERSKRARTTWKDL